METSPSAQIDSMLLVLIPMLVGAALFKKAAARASRSFPV